MSAPAISAVSHRVAAALACPRCHTSIVRHDDEIACEMCRTSYPVVNGVLDLRPASVAGRQEETDWTEHWSAEKQDSRSQRFFSFYRKAVFARAVAYFIHRYLPREGVLVEAGSGTSETSMLIDKLGGKRSLVAVDLIRPVLERCHPVIDVAVCGDIFALPFQDGSIDGIWNVGVMEHFPHSRIDAILKEFRRVLKPNGRIVLLWPATFSIPQRILRVLEWFINRKRRTDKFRFHPDEISQLSSAKQGRQVLTRNGFHPVAIDLGLRTLMAFETIVGEKSGASKKDDRP
jgi:SAM-dependent methyltransferase